MMTKWNLEKDINELFLAIFGVKFKPQLCFGNCVYTKDELDTLKGILIQIKSCVLLL
jgi:hypothetical protein